MKMVVSYLNFVFLIKIKAKSKYKIVIEFCFSIYQKNEMALRVHGFSMLTSTSNNFRIKTTFQIGTIF